MRENSNQEKLPQDNFVGVFIPIGIWLDPILSANEKFLWQTINSLDMTSRHCYATNKYLAEKTNLSEWTVKKGIRRLEKLGYLKILKKRKRKTLNPNGTQRILKTKKKLFKIPRYQEVYKLFYLDKLKKKDEKRKAENNLQRRLENNRNISYRKNIRSSLSLLRKRKGRTPEGSGGPSLKNETKYILDKWNELGWPFTKHHKGTATYSKIEKAAEKALEKHSPEKIKKAIETFGSFIKHDQTKLNPKAIRGTLKLHEFFGFSLWLKKTLEKNKLLRHTNGWFEDAVQGRKYLLEKYGKFIENKYPVVARKIQEGWEKLFTDFESKASDLNNFRKAAEKLVDFIQFHKKNLRVSNRELHFPAQFVPYMMEYIKKGGMLSSNRRVHSGYLVQDFFYDEGLYEWLVKNNYLTRRKKNERTSRTRP